MSLNWNITKCTNSEELVVEGKAWDYTHALIFELAVIDIGEITEKNVVEVKLRSDYWRRLDGVLPLIPLEEIQRRVGLYCNVITKPFPSFASRIAKNFRNDAIRAHREVARG